MVPGDGVRAQTATRTSRAPALRSAAAQADAVAPVVSTSSTRRTGASGTRARAANAPWAQARRAGAPSALAAGPASLRLRSTPSHSGTPASAASSRASTDAGSNPRRHRDNEDEGTGTMPATPWSTSETEIVLANCPASWRRSSGRCPSFPLSRKRRARSLYVTEATVHANGGGRIAHRRQLPAAAPAAPPLSASGKAHRRQRSVRPRASSAQHAGHAPRSCTRGSGPSQPKQRAGNSKTAASPSQRLAQRGSGGRGRGTTTSAARRAQDRTGGETLRRERCRPEPARGPDHPARSPRGSRPRSCSTRRTARSAPTNPRGSACRRGIGSRAARAPFP